GKAGVIWIGPPPAALRLGGDKVAAKRVALAAGVPVLPEGDSAAIGFPLVVKAAAGGGGRGMRVVRAPAELDEALAAASREAAAAFATAIGYRNAGTAEFLVAGDDVYFLELNGRIQVEHPVTECVYGVDIVELQIRVARGESLADARPEAHGHAIEVRLCAE